MTQKRLISLLLTLLLCVGAVACAPQATQSNGEPDFRFTDDLNRAVALPYSPERVAVLFSSYVEIWTLAGGTTSITVGESVKRGLVDKSVPLVDANAGKTVNIEALLSMEPDFVIASADIDGQRALEETLRDARIPVAYFRVETFEDYLRMLDVCTQITGDREAYARHGEQVRQQIDAILSADAAHTSEKILFIRAGSSIAKAKTAKEHFACGMLDTLGTQNIAENAPILLDGLSIETILVENPTFIFVSTMGDEDAAIAHMEQVLSEDAWSSLDAVQNGRVFYLPKDLFQYKPNHRWAEAYEYLAEILYGSQQ